MLFNANYLKLYMYIICNVYYMYVIICNANYLKD